MHSELDHDLTSDQWAALRALRPAAPAGKLNGYVVQQLGTIGLVVLSDGAPQLTPQGRAVLLRGSPQLWDLAA